MKRTSDRREIQSQTSICGGMMVAVDHVVVVAVEVVVAVVVAVVAAAAAVAAAVEVGLEIVVLLQRFVLVGCMYGTRLRVGLGHMEVMGQRQEEQTSEALDNWTLVRFYEVISKLRLE
jgi:hypothetical protein